MLKLLLDEHISPQVAKGLRRGHRGFVVYAMRDWEGGSFLGQEDSACLRDAAAQHLTLVTYDRRTIPPLLKTWAGEQRRHGGVIFVDDKSIAPSEIGVLVRALSAVINKFGGWNWTDRIVFLRR